MIWNIHATDDIGDGLRDAVITGQRVTLAAFIEQLNKLGREPASQAVQLTNPAVVILLRYDLNATQHQPWPCIGLSSVLRPANHALSMSQHHNNDT